MEAEPPPSVPEEGFVVLPFGSRVYLEPRFGGASSRLGWPSMSPPPWPPTGYVARVVGHVDGFVEIAPIVRPVEQHCAPVFDGESTLDVRLYVSPWALAPVVARNQEVLLDGGATLSLRPGALAQPIEDDPRGRWAISAGGIRVRASLPEDALAYGYAEPRPLTLPSQRSWQLPEGRPFSFDGAPLEVDLSFGLDVAIASVQPRDGDFEVELVSPCARVLAHSSRAPVTWVAEPFTHFTEFGLGGSEEVPAGVLEAVGIEVAEPESAVEGGVSGLFGAGDPGDPPPELDPTLLMEAQAGVIGGLIGSTAPARPEHVFEQGAPVYLSPAGPVAGTLAELRVFGEDGWATGDRMCFHTSFGSRFDPPLPVCLPAAEARVRNPVVDVHDFSAGVVRPGELRITGALEEPMIARILRRHRNDLRRCLNEAMMVGIPAAGTLELELDVSGKGGIAEVRLASPPVQPLADCALAAAKRWHVPAPTDGKPARIVFSVRLEQR